MCSDSQNSLDYKIEFYKYKIKYLPNKFSSCKINYNHFYMIK